MKRTLLALLAVLGTTFIGLAPTKAQAQVTCTIQSIPGITTNILRTCTGVTSTIEGNAASALSVQKANALSKLQDGNHWFFVFAQAAQFAPYTAANPTILPAPKDAPPAGAQGYTYQDPNNSAHWFSVIFVDKLGSGSNAPQNAVAHEAGHHYDSFYAPVSGGANSASETTTAYSAKLMGAQLKITGGETSQSGSISVTFNILNTQQLKTGTTQANPYFNTYKDNNGNANVVTITRPIVTGDSPTSIATYFYNQITGGTLSTKGVTSPSDSPLSSGIVYIHTQTPIRYTYTVTGTFQVAFAQHDWSLLMNMTPSYGQSVSYPQCAPNGSTWGGYKDSAGNFICSSSGNGTTLASTYAGLDNAQIALKAWTYFFVTDTPTGAFPRWSETWAEGTAIMTGFPEGPPTSPDAPFLNGVFGCSNEYLNYIQTYNQLAPEYEYGPNCQGL